VVRSLVKARMHVTRRGGVTMMRSHNGSDETAGKEMGRIDIERIGQAS